MYAQMCRIYGCHDQASTAAINFMGVKVKACGCIWCPRWQASHPQRTQIWITNFIPQRTPCLPLAFVRIYQMVPPWTVVTVVATYYSFIDPERMKVGWLQRTVFPHKWSPVSCRSSAGQRKLAGQWPTFYRCATEPTTEVGRVKFSWGIIRIKHLGQESSGWPISSAAVSHQCYYRQVRTGHKRKISIISISKQKYR